MAHGFRLFMPEELYAALQARATEEDRSIAATVREAIRRYLAEKEESQ